MRTDSKLAPSDQIFVLRSGARTPRQIITQRIETTRPISTLSFVKQKNRMSFMLQYSERGIDERHPGKSTSLWLIAFPLKFFLIPLNSMHRTLSYDTHILSLSPYDT